MPQSYAEGLAQLRAEDTTQTTPQSYRDTLNELRETTQLSPTEEAHFQQWVSANRSAPGVGTYDAPESKYDMRGFWNDKPALAAWKPGEHFPDTYKQHGHPTFSVESKYSKGHGDGGTWAGDTFVPATTAGRRPPVRQAELVAQTPATITEPQPYPDIDPRTGMPVTNVPAGRMPVLDLPIEGVKQVGAGVASLGRQLAHPAVLPADPHVTPASAPGADEAAMNGLADLLEGVGKMATPLAVAGAIVNLPGTALTLGASWLASEATARAAQYAQASPGTQRFLSALAGTAVAVGGAAKMVEGLNAAAESAVSGAKRSGRIFTLAAKLSGSGYGTGDVPAYRANPTTVSTGEAAPVGSQAEPPTADAIAQAKAELPAPDAPSHTFESAPPEAEPLRATVQAPTRVPPVAAAQPPAVEQMPAAPPEFHAVEPETSFTDELRKLRTEEPPKYSSTQVQLPPHIAEKIGALSASIPDEDLADGGREDDPHVTVKYGIHTDDVGPIKTALADQAPITVRFGKTSMFPDSGHGEVLKVDVVDSPDLHALNKRIADWVDTTDTHPDYLPHATIAYLKPGKAQQYVGRTDLEGDSAIIDQVVFSTPDDETHVIPLTGQGKEDPAASRRRDEQKRQEKPARVGEEDVARVEFLRKSLRHLNNVIANATGPNLANYIQQWDSVSAELETLDPAVTAQPRVHVAPNTTFTEALDQMRQEDQDGLTYDEFATQYREAFKQNNKYTPGQVGSQHFTDQMATLADAYPEHLERLEREEETGVKSGSEHGADTRDDAGELPARPGRAPGSDRTGGQGPLAAVSPEGDQGPGAERPVRAGQRDTGGVVADGVSSDAPDDRGSPHVSPAGGGDSPAPVAVSPSGATHDPGHARLDYDLTPERIQAIIARGAVTRAKDNLAAIRLVKTLGDEERYATSAEQDILAKYVGWGDSALAAYLHEYPKSDWSKNERAVWDEIQALPSDELAALRRSTLNAHFTFDLYAPIWTALVRAGFHGGRVLEPAIGVGHAFGFMPPDVRHHSTLNASKLEPLTAAIAGYLYPSVTVQATGYEHALVARNTQDLVISNVPFGDFGVDDKTLPDFITERIHNYFFGKAIEHTRPGGLIVFVTSRYTLDGPKATKVRRYLAERADFLGAVRLPNSAFDKSAKTEVVTDLIVLRKRAEGDPESSTAKLFIDAAEHPDLQQERDWKGKAIGGVIYRSAWYTAHPEYVLGTESREGTMRARGEYTVTAKAGTLTAQIDEALKTLLPPGTYVPASRQAARPVKMAEGPYKPGELRIGEKKGTIARVDKDGAVTDATPRRPNGDPDKGAIARLTGMIVIRDALNKLATAELADATDVALKPLRKALNTTYHQFVQQYGDLNKTLNKRLFASDPEASNLLGLETLKAKATIVTRKDGKRLLQVSWSVTGLSDIFTKRTLKAPKVVSHVDTSKDGLLASLGLHAAIDWPYISQITGTPVAAIQQDLIGQGLVFEQPDGSFVLAEEYLSGDVVTKHEDAQSDKQRFKRNLDALSAVLPAPKTGDDIQTGVVGVNLGAHWVDPDDLGRFVDGELGLSRRSVVLDLQGTSTLVRWNVASTDAADRASGRHALAVHYANTSKTYGFLDLLDDALNLKQPDLGHFEGSGDNRVWVKEPLATLAARANQEILRANWLQYVFADEDLQTRLLDVYNTRFNRTVERQHDGAWLTLPGKTDAITFYPHQLRAVARILTTGNTLVAHEVGAGKTFEMIAAAMEMRRTGRASKPMIVVPTYLLSAWRADVVRLYPRAKILAFDEKDLEKSKRQTAMARIAFGDWDIVLVPHSSFGLLKTSDQRIVDMMQRWIAELEDAIAEGERGNTKEWERQKRKIEDKVRAKLASMNTSTDNALVWEQLGVDALFIDEAQAFKNLFFFSKLDNLRGLSRSESDRALDLFVKIQEINEQSHERNLVLATATPVMNSLAEAYTMQRYLQPTALRQYGVENFDSWYAMFAKALPTTEQQPDGTYKEVMRLRDFSNLHLLSKMVREVMDYMGWEDMPYLKLPKIAGGKVEIVQTDPHPMYAKVKEWFAIRMQNLRDLPPHVNQHTGEYIAPDRPDPLTGESMGKPDNILTVMTDAKKAAVDVRLVLGDRATDVPGSRIQVAADKMARWYKEEMDRKGVQLVFLDMGTPQTPPPLDFLTDVVIEDTRDEDERDEDVPESDDGDDGGGLFNLYDALKKELMKRGVPAREIAYLHSAKNSAERIALFAAANDGTVRFVFASTDKGGIGMNIQTRLMAIHEIDAPRYARPGDLRQRMGRGIRQGNTYDQVHLVRYVTKGTTDEWLWGVITTKDYQIRQFLKGQAATMTEDDPSTMSLEEAQIRSSGDPRGIELTTLKGKLARLEAQALAGERAVAQAKSDVQRGTLAAAHATKDLADVTAWLKAHYAPLRGDQFTVTIGVKTYTDRTKANAALVTELRPIVAANTVENVRVGELGGLALVAQAEGRREFTKTNEILTYPGARVYLDEHPIGQGQVSALHVEQADPAKASSLGEGSNPMASLVTAYERIPSLEAGFTDEITRGHAQRAAGERVLAKPPSVITEHKAAVVRIRELETELKAEGDANAQTRREEKQERARQIAKPSVAGLPSAVGTLPVRPAPAKQTVALPVDAIVTKLSLLFDKVPVSVGHYRQRFRAIYKVDPHAVRSREANDLYAITHEFGHHLDLTLMRGSATHVKGDIAKELRTLGAPTSKPSYPAAMRRQEGAAEFFRIWLLEPERLPLEAPLYLKEFERYLTQHPDIFAGLLEIRDDIQTYLSLAPDEQTRLHIDFTGGSRAVMARAQRLATQATDAEGRRDVLTYLSSQWIDDLAWLNRAERDLTDGRPIDITQSAYVLARLARGATEKAEGFLRFGVRDVDGHFLGTSFDDAISGVLTDLAGFAQYATAIHAREMAAEGIASGLSDGQIQATIQRYKSPAFDTALDRLAEFHRAKRKYLVETGILSARQAKAMSKRWADYVPMQRVRETATNALASSKRLANRTSPVKRLRGSVRRVINPLESIIRNTHAEVAVAEANKAMLALVRLVTKTPGSARWMEEVPTPKVPVTFNLSQVEQAIRDDLEQSGIEIPTDWNFDDLATVWMPRQFARGNERFVTVIDEGTLRWFEVHEPGLYDAITAIGPQNTEQVLRWFQAGAQTLRKYATATLGFVLGRNPARDVMSAVVQSRAGFRPTDFLRGLFGYLGHDEAYQLYVHSGAGQATLVAADRDLIRRRLKDLGRTKTRQFLNHTVLGPIDGLQALSQALETATRLGEFKRTLKKLGVSEGGLLQGALNARDVTQDFSVMGRQVRAWNRYVAFSGARVGGYTRLYQAWQEGGGGGKTPPGAPPGTPPGGATGGFGKPRSHGEAGPIAFLWKSLSSITLVSVLLWVLHKDDDQYTDLPAWERNAYWHIPIPGGGYIKIVKPFELGQLFGTSVEMALDWLVKHDPTIVNRLPDKSTATQMLLMAVPTILLPPIEVAANYDFFRDRAIVNPYDTDLEPSLQYNRWTTETAKRLGKWLDLSPAKIETLIYGYTAGVGSGTLQGIDLLTPGSGSTLSSDPGHWPVVGSLYRAQVSSDAQSLTDFYEARDRLNGVKGSLTRYRQQGQSAQADTLRTDNADLLHREGAIRGTDAQLKAQRSQVNRIFANPALTPAQKRQQLDAVYRRMRQAARRALGQPPLR